MKLLTVDIIIMTNKTPIEDLRKSALKNYDRAASSAMHWDSSIPRAINFYFHCLKFIESKDVDEGVMEMIISHKNSFNEFCKKEKNVDYMDGMDYYHDLLKKFLKYKMK